MNHIYLTTLLASLTYCAASVVNTSNNNAGAFELLILHNNDMHARFEQTSQLSGACTPLDREAGKCYGGFPRVAYVVKEARKAAAAGTGPPVLYLNAGDTYTGTPWFTIYKWKIAAEFINALQPDAVSLGNHELDDRVEGLVPFIKSVKTPVLAANVILNKTQELRDLPNMKKSIILNVDGVKVGVIGYLTPETQYLAPPNDVEYEDEVIALRREVEKLQEEGVNIIIALGHSGYSKDLEIAKEVDGIDLVIGGHTNTFLSNQEHIDERPEISEGPYPVIVEQKSGRKVPVVQAYAYTKYLGRLHLIFDSEGEIIHINGEPILLDHSIPRDPEVYHLVKIYKNKTDHIFNESVGKSSVLLDGSCRLRECNIGDLICDAIMAYTKEIAKLCADIVIVQGGRIRASIDKPEQPFNTTRGDWFTVIPFEDQLALVTMNGSTLLEALEHSVSTWSTIDSTGQFLQFSGMKVMYDLSKPPGSRVVLAKSTATLDSASCKQTQFADIHEDMEYRVVMPTFLLEGGDGYSMFLNQNSSILDYNELSGVYYFLSKYDTVNPKLNNRLIILNSDKLYDKKTIGNDDSLSSRPILRSSSAACNNSANTFFLLAIFWFLIVKL